MIHKSDKLFDFIKSMTSHERGYFKQSTNKDSFYMILFNAMCRQDVYNEEELVRELKNKGCKRKIAAMKDYLWHELTQAMAPYHLIKTPMGEAMAKIQALYLIHNKGLTKHVIKELDVIKKFCIKYELYDTWLHALQFEFSFGFQQHLLNDNFWIQFHEAVKANMIYLQLSEIQHKLYVTSLQHKNIEPGTKRFSEIKLLMTHPVLYDSTVGKMTRMILARESILELYAQITKDYNGIIKHNMQIADLLESKPHLIKDGREISLIYTNIAIALANGGQRKKLAESIDEIMHKLMTIPHNHTYSLARELEVQVLKMLTLNDFSELESIMKIFRLNFSKIPVSVKHHLYYNFTICYHKNGENEKALDIINEAIVFYRRHKLFSDANLNMLHLVHLLIHYELKNHVYVKNQLETHIRTYKPEQKEGDVISVTMKYLKEALKTTNPSGEFEKLRSILNRDFKSANNTILWDLRLWAQSFIGKKTYPQLCRETALAELN